MRVFLSYPMNGFSREQCLKFRNDMIRNLKPDVEWVDNLDCDGPEYDDESRTWYLGEAIKVLGTCDAIMIHPWALDYKGCQVEMKVAELYGIQLLQMQEEDFTEFCDGNNRTRNTLLRNGISSRAGLARLTEKEAKNFRNCGKVTLNHIMELKSRL